jgi:hypothetical protein
MERAVANANNRIDHTIRLDLPGNDNFFAKKSEVVTDNHLVVPLGLEVDVLPPDDSHHS